LDKLTVVSLRQLTLPPPTCHNIVQRRGVPHPGFRAVASTTRAALSPERVRATSPGFPSRLESTLLALLLVLFVPAERRPRRRQSLRCGPSEPSPQNGSSRGPPIRRRGAPTHEHWGLTPRARW